MLAFKKSFLFNAGTTNAGEQQNLAAAKLQALVELEAYSLRRHTHQASVLLMARVRSRPRN